MKRIIAVLLCILLVLLSAGCKNVAPSDPTTVPTETNAPTETETPPVETTVMTEPVVPNPSIVAVSFHTEREDFRADDGNVIFTSSAPSLDLFAPENENIRKIVSDFAARTDSSEIRDLQQNILALANEWYTPDIGWYAYTMEQKYQAARIDSHILSLSGTVTSYSGGVHPNHYLTSVTYDLQSGKPLTLSDILCGEDSIPLLSDMVLSSLSNSGENTWLFDDYISVVLDHFDPDNPLFDCWYLSENGLVIYFSVYEISSYAAGDFVLEYPYSSLDGILDPAFLPEETGDISGELTVQLHSGPVREDLNLISAIYLANDGPKVLLSADGVVSNVRIETGNWGGDGSMFYVSDNLFAANVLTSDHSVLIQTILTESNPNIRISYETTEGEFSRYLAMDFETSELKLLSGAK